MKTTGNRLRSGRTLTNRTSTGSPNKSKKISGTTVENKKTATKTLRSKSKKSDLIKPETTKGKEKKDTAPRTIRKNTSGNGSTRRIVLSSKRKVNIPEGVNVKNKMTSFRQISLKESFTNQETLSKRLRPRKESRNYCEDSVLQQRRSQQRKDAESINKLPGCSNSKLPVYKTAKLNEESLRNMSDVYDFKFDENDSKERIEAKRKRRVINRVKQKKVKKTVSVRPKKVVRVVTEKLSDDVISTHTAKKTKENTKKKIEDKNEKKDILLPSTRIEKKSKDNATEKHTSPQFPDASTTETECNDVQNLEVEDLPPMQAVEDTEVHPNINTPKPKIISIETFNNHKVSLTETPLKPDSENFVPFRKTNIFRNRVTLQHGNMINNSLINKSLSPIKKTSANFDAGSPWRMSSLNTFSQVKNLFQSTPLPRTLEILHGKVVRKTTDQTNKFLEPVKTNTVLEAVNEDTNTRRPLEKSNYVNRKIGQAIRKFGTEITNLDHSVSASNASTVTEQYEGVADNRESRLPSVNLQNTMGSAPLDPSAFDDTMEDKENAAPKSVTKTGKLSRKRLKKISNSPLRKERRIQDKENSSIQLKLNNTQTFNHSISLPHAQEEKQERSKEIFEPQPGPSGLQKHIKSPCKKPLQQTNLNVFLNITEMPQSTRISTVHGIFDDAHSTPISGKPLKPVKIADTKHMELDNAFGFNEEDGNDILDISPIYPESANVDVQDKKVVETNVEEIKRISALPIRLMPVKIKKDIARKDVDAGEKDKQNTDEENINGGNVNKEKVNREEELLPSIKNKVIDPVNFSDTFDIMEEVKEAKDDVPDVPLFTDLEPIHFKEPPRRSYKRKRNVKFNFSESLSDEEEESDHHLPERKKQKHGKLKKEDVKRMHDWVKSINQTFQEIDHHELFVE